MEKINNTNNVIQKSLSVISISISLFIHLVIFLTAILYFKLFQTNPILPGEYVEISTIRGNITHSQILQKDKDINPLDPALPAEKIEKQAASPKEKVTPANNNLIMTAGFDSTSLNQIYHESTLNVRLKYPAGWVYVDQQRKNKLDGITFWAAAGNYNPPPYIHVEVVNKFMFIPDQYKYKYEFKDFEGYYNDPVELANQVTQSIYLRTDDDEDFIIKLIMTGKDQFNSFQPIFFSMVNSFKFGNSLF